MKARLPADDHRGGDGVHGDLGDQHQGCGPDVAVGARQPERNAMGEHTGHIQPGQSIDFGPHKKRDVQAVHQHAQGRRLAYQQAKVVVGGLDRVHGGGRGGAVVSGVPRLGVIGWCGGAAHGQCEVSSERLRR